MFFSLLFRSPGLLIAWIVAVLIAITIHEFSHALMAKMRGDRTAEREGRLSLNPIDHVDPIGFLMLLLLGFGWAKPVPYNPYNLHNPKWDSVAVGLAGPASNLLMAIVASFGLKGLLASGFDPFNLACVFLFLLVYINLLLLFFNAIPIHPLDGAKLLLALFDGPRHEGLRRFILVHGPQILFLLVMLSFLGFNPFGFISAWATSTCDILLSGSCSGYLVAL